MVRFTLVTIFVIVSGLPLTFVCQFLHKEALRQGCENKGGMWINLEEKDFCLKGLNQLELEKKWKK